MRNREMKVSATIFGALLLGSLLTATAAEFTYTENDNSGSNIALGFPPPQPVATTTPGAWFREYDSLHAVHQALALNNSFITAHNVGSTWSGEDIWAYRFGDADNLANSGMEEGSVFVNGSIHAREWQTQEATTGLMEYLASIANDNAVGSYLHDNLNIVILPVHNIDGFRQTQVFWNRVTESEQQPRDGRMRRKNLHAPGDGTVDGDLATIEDNLYGVDLNRNMAAGFAENDGSSGTATSLIYRGSVPSSEPETQALESAVDTLAPNLRFYEDTHSFSQLMFVPQTGATERDEQAVALAHVMSDAVGGRYFVSIDPVDGAIGTTADYFAYTYSVPAWTLELEPQYQAGATQYGGFGVSHDGFILPEAEVPRLRDEYNAMHRDTFYDRAGPPHLAEVRIRDSVSGNVVYHELWLPGDPNRSRATAVDDALVPGNTYEVWLAFDKPMRFAAGAAPAISMVSEDGNTQLGISLANGQWLANPGGFPAGYWRYERDAYGVELTLPATVESGRWMLVVDTLDATGAKLDANPETVVDFVNGVWTDYETYYVRGITDPQEGNSDCNNAPRIGTDSSTAAFNRGACFDFLADRDGARPVSRGGGAAGWLYFLLAVAMIPLRRRRMQ